MVELPLDVVQWKLVSQGPGVRTEQYVKLKLQHIPLDGLHRLQSLMNAELRRWEETVYK